MRRLLLLFGFTLLAAIADCKPPELTPQDTKIKIEEILRAHVSHQKLTPELIRRAFVNYLDEVDPAKTYLIEPEVVKWINPDEELLNRTLRGFKKADFTPFEELHDVFLTAIERRNQLEKELEGMALPKDVQPSEFKDLSWTTSMEDLKTRLLRIKALQLDAADKLNQESRAQFLQRLTKRRLNRESEMVAKSAKEKQQIVLSLLLKASSSALDSQTAYFTPAEANQFMMQVQQKLFGIGAQLRDDLNGFTIVKLLDGSPAGATDKLKVGDRIIAVNNEPVVGMDITEAVELIRGPQGTAVTLTILRELGDTEAHKEDKLLVEIVRGEIILKESRLETFYEPYGDGVIGILHLFSFYQDNKSSSASDLAQAIQAMKREHNVKGIILDLRNNAGGLLPQAVSVTGLFISKGIVVSVKDNTGQIQHLRNIEDRKVWDGPLIVLTNKSSASASEIVAQTLQDYGRAIVVGDQTTYGKGTFQTFTLESANYGKVNPKGEYKVTRGRYYTVSGKSPQLTGVTSDIIVPGIFSQIELGEKFSKFPLENDIIPANFEDDLADIPMMHRDQISRLYRYNLQPILTLYQPYIEVLKKNSADRIQLNKNYQNFLKELSNKDLVSENMEIYGQSDLQLNETLNIFKDLIFMIQEREQLLPTGTGG